MTARRPSSIAGHRRRNQIAGTFTALLTEMLKSPAWRVLSLSAHRVLDRVAIELRHHGGREGDGLCVTYDDFEKYGMDRHAIAPAIREVVALGFLRITREGRAGNSEFRRPTWYKLTFVNTVDGEPTHEWKRIKSLHEADMKAREARVAKPRKTKRQCGKPTPASVGGTPIETGNFPVGETPTNAVGKTPTTLDISGGRRRPRLNATGSSSPIQPARRISGTGDR
jgi:hypothetical protein